MTRQCLRRLVMTSVATLARIWLRVGARLTVHNKSVLRDAVLRRNPSIPLLTVSNHISTLDDPVMWGGLLDGGDICELLARDGMRYTVAAEELLFTNWLYRWFFSTGQVIPIVRGGGLVQAGMAQSLAVMNAGGWMHVFPEGRVITRPGHNDYRVGRLEWGVGQLLMESERAAVVLPVMLRGFDRMKPPGWRLRMNRPVEIVVGEPVDASRFLDESRQMLNEQERRIFITARIQDAMNRTLQMTCR